MKLASSSTDMWHILRAFVGNPIKIAQLITDRGYSAYCPSEVVKRRHPFHRNVITVRKPLFPGYLFVLTREGGFHWSMIESAHIRARFVCVDDRCIVLDHREIDEIRGIEAERAKPPSPPRPMRKPKVGETVKILWGVLYGQEASVVSIKRRRAAIKLKSGTVADSVFVRLDQIEPFGEDVASEPNSAMCRVG